MDTCLSGSRVGRRLQGFLHPDARLQEDSVIDGNLTARRSDLPSQRD
jgi:hypothetical protein